VRVVVGFAPGGGADATARIFALKLSEAMGQSWIVDNRTGAGGNLSTELVATANPDGHTVLVFLDSQLTANPSLYSLPFSVEKDLLPVAVLASTDMVVVVHPALPAKTFKEFVALAKQKPGTLHYGSGGVGSAL
jgi:tripartite-type tricarboxylate transporter receptor subunit TctC